MKKKIVTYEEVEISKKLRKECIEYLEANKMEMYFDYRDEFDMNDDQGVLPNYK